ncbi:hypothetical protein P879_06316 [Paragonimus westermani]|uniref:Large ribosomal subunit protein mL38 n=1 Tax=Paragonimus westermani TaxID=34504 RepID=A0A8T0DPA8_9TREM|nr:hypothetical protein P879_06316 [Paragonimus westermani]
MWLSRTFRKLTVSTVTLPHRNHWYRRGYVPVEVEPGQYPYPKRQVPTLGKSSFKDRLSELTQDLLESSSLLPVDIGLPYKAGPLLPNRSQQKKTELEAAARKLTLRVPVDAIHSTSEDTQAPVRRLLVAQHYGVFNSLFGPPHFFVPQVDFKPYFLENPGDRTSVDLSSEQNTLVEVDLHPVYMGNLITPKLAMTPPYVDLSSAPSDYLWTLVMSCPDEPFGDEDGLLPTNEYVHWMVANLRAGPEATGDEIIPYLPPLPYLGTGYHRYIFTLYRQDMGKVDLTEFNRDHIEGDLRTQRSFHTLEFYRRLESQLTPAGLAFFQSSWDESVRMYFRNVLDIPEPIFEVQWPTPRLPPQERYPVANSWNKARRHPHGLPLIRERYGVHNDVSFDVYLDKYRDRKELNEELIRERLRNEGNPLDPDEPRRIRLEYPAAVPLPKGMPSWWMKQETQRRLRRGRWRHLEGHDG